MNQVKVYMCSSHYFFHVLVIWKVKNKKLEAWDSLVVQWLRIHLPVQRTWVSTLVQEDPTWQGASEPMCHNYWAHTLEPTGCSYGACSPQYWSFCTPEPKGQNKRSHVSEKLCTAVKSSLCLPQLEKACKQQRRTSRAKKKRMLEARQPWHKSCLAGPVTKFTPP